MASRTKVQSVEIDGIDLVALFVTVVEFSPTEESPVTVQELDDETGQSTFDALNILADAELIGFERGNVWVVIPDVSEANASQTAYDALMTHPLPPVEAPKPKRATKAKAPVEVVLPNPDDASPANKGWIAKAQQPVKAADGTNVTVPVSEDSEERRELDASKGERLISEDLMSDVIQNLMEETWIPTFDESKITEDFEAPEMLPAIPVGVSENTWFMAHCANTESARAWWSAKADAQINAHNLNQPEVAPF